MLSKNLSSQIAVQTCFWKIQKKNDRKIVTSHKKTSCGCCAYQGENNLSSHVEERVNGRKRDREKKVEVRSNYMLSKA